MRRNLLGTEWEEQCVGQKEQPVWRLRGENELHFLKDQKGEGQCGWGRATRTKAEVERWPGPRGPGRCLHLMG